MNTARGLAIVGTDTGVGKTTVSRGLLALARRHGMGILPFKPVESGVTNPDESDAELLRRAAGSTEPASLYRLPCPIAPATAARHAAVSIDLDVIRRRALELAHKDAGLLLETAGGLLSPWNGRRGAADLLVALGLPAVLIAADVLGVQNHALLTAEALARRQIPLAAVLLVGRGSEDAQWENESTFEDLFGSTYFGRIPRLSPPSDASLAEALDRCRGRELLTFFGGGSSANPFK